MLIHLLAYGSFALHAGGNYDLEKRSPRVSGGNYDLEKRSGRVSSSPISDLCQLPPLAPGASTLQVNDLTTITSTATDEELIEFYPAVLSYSENVNYISFRILSHHFSFDF
jgi:hypothetical protein